MLRSTAGCWTLLVLAFLCAKGLDGVTVTVNPIVVTDVGKTYVTFPCDYTLEKPNQQPNTRWDMGNDLVIAKDLLGNVFYGHNYKERVSWGAGCSMNLHNPSLKESGFYKFNVTAPMDNSTSAAAKVQLIIMKDTSAGVTCGPPSNTTAGSATKGEVNSPDLGQFLTILSTASVTLVFPGVLYFSGGKYIGKQWIGLMVTAIILLWIGIATAIADMATGNTALRIVSCATVSVGVAIQEFVTNFIVFKEYND